MDYRNEALKIPAEDRPISPKSISGLSSFFGIYGGEHIAATEFVIGATLVTLGVKATDIFIGLFIGNILATLTYDSDAYGLSLLEFLWQAGLCLADECEGSGCVVAHQFIRSVAYPCIFGGHGYVRADDGEVVFLRIYAL